MDMHEDGFRNSAAHSTHSGCWPQIIQTGQGDVGKRQTKSHDIVHP
jgi:hypothetical protein